MSSTTSSRATIPPPGTNAQTWRGVLPVLLAILRNGANEARHVAIVELSRMAEAADKYNEMVKLAKKNAKKGSKS